MSDNFDTTTKKGKKRKSLIDPVYKKFSGAIIRTLASTEFYDYFMAEIAQAKNQFQFSNRKKETIIDLKWIDAIEKALPSIQQIIEVPRRVIKEEELIVNVAHARKTTSDVVRHLAQHGSMVDEFDEKTGNVRPNKLMQKFRDDSEVLYENRLVYTVMENAYHFVKIRYEALTEEMGDEFGAKLKMSSDMESMTENVHFDMFLHIKKKDDLLTTDDKNRDVYERISRLYRLLGSFMNTEFANHLSKQGRIQGALTKTNVLKKNLKYKSVVKLYDFMRSYKDVGYVIRIKEQNPEISESFEQDIYHNIMFNYIVLKNYLEEEGDRNITTPLNERKKTIKPVFIKKIVEELTEDYDLPDVEIRKVLIEELTKEQLMQETEEERLRLVEEQERARKEAEAEAEKARLEAEEKEEQLRLEREKQEAIKRQNEEADRLERELEDRRRGDIFKAEWELFQQELPVRIEKRNAFVEEILQKAFKMEDDEAKLFVYRCLGMSEEIFESHKRKAEEEAALAKAAAEAEQKQREEELVRLQEARRQADIELALREKEERSRADQHAEEIFAPELFYFKNTVVAQKEKRAEYERQIEEEKRKREEEKRLRKQKKSMGMRSKS